MKHYRERLEEAILPLVAKPGRYVPFSEDPRRVPEDGTLHVCVAVPRPFEAALADARVQTLLQTLDATPGLHPDVTVAPEADIESALRDGRLPWFSLIGHRPLHEFDVILVYVTEPLEVPDAAALLELGGVSPLLAKRTPDAPRVVLVGPLAWSPASLAGCVDAAWVGDPEPFLTDLARDGKTFAADGLTAGVWIPGQPGEVSPRLFADWPVSGDSPWMPLCETEAHGAVLELTRPTHDLHEPARAREVSQSVNAAEDLLSASGYGELTLAGAGRHPEFLSLLERMSARFSAQRVGLRVEGLHPRVLTEGAARELCKGRRQRLRLEPVAASARLRQSIGGALSRQELVKVAEHVRRGGWSNLEFRVIAGAPGETPADHREWLDTLLEVSRIQLKEFPPPRLSLVVVPYADPAGAGKDGFAPKVYAEAVDVYRRELKRAKIRVSARPALAARVEALFRAGHPEVGEHMVRVAAAGGRRQALADTFAPELWERLFNTRNAPPPISHSSVGFRLVTPVISQAPIPNVNGASLARGAAVLPSGNTPPSWNGGRRPRRAGRSSSEPRLADRYRLKFAKDEPLRFTSHLDVTRAFERALRRTHVPVALSQGKDRRQKISFGPPLPLGMTSGSEFLDIMLSRDVPESFVRSLNQGLPHGLTVVAAAPIRVEPASLNSAVQTASYSISFSDTLIAECLGGISFDELKDRLDQRVAQVMAAETFSVTRIRGETSKTYNARPSILLIEVVRDDGGRPALTVRLALNRPDSVRPELLTTALINWADLDERLLRVHRSSLTIPGRHKDFDPLEVVAPGFAWWRQSARKGSVV